MKKFLSLVLAFSLFFVCAQNRKGEFQLSKDVNQHALYVRISSDINFTEWDQVQSELLQKVPSLLPVLADYDFQIKKGIPLTKESYERLLKNSKANSSNGNAVKILRNIFRVEIDHPTNDRLLQLAKELEKLNEVVYVSLMPLEPIAPPNDIPPPTPNLETIQGYLDSDPGVNIKYAWSMGIDGAGIRVRDVEYGFNKDHEELNELNLSLGEGMTINSVLTEEYTEHGTAVFGVLGANKGTYGSTGMVYNADEFVLFPEYQETGYNRVEAVTQAINHSTFGDVILYEMQTGGQNNEYVPAEYNSVIWDLTKAATESGIIIVAAAGNGSQNLDAPFYQSYMNRGHSGAIMVGAGEPDTSHASLTFTTFGSRLDLQGWGYNVVTSGYGDLIQYGDDFNQSYTSFSGTSSATPIVASCVIALQSYYHSVTGNYLNGQQLRDILVETGIPQDPTDNRHIGPLPNMEAAIQKLQDDYMAVADVADQVEFKIYPNPVQDKLYVVYTGKSKFQAAHVEIYNLAGQKIKSDNFSKNLTLDTSNWGKGIYLLNVVNEGKILRTEKLIKQ